MSPRELAICLEERWITRYSLVQQIDRFQQIRLCITASGRGKAHSQKKIFGATIEIKGGEIHCWWPLNSQTFIGRDFDVKLARDFLSDLTLDSEDIFQIAIVFFRPHVRVGSGIDQLDIYVKPGSGFAQAPFQYVGYTQGIADVACVVLVAISHHAGTADDFQIRNLRQLGQEVVLDTVSEGGVFSVVAQIFKR